MKFVGVDALFIEPPRPLPFCDLYKFEDDMVGVTRYDDDSVLKSESKRERECHNCKFPVVIVHVVILSEVSDTPPQYRGVIRGLPIWEGVRVTG